MRRALIFDVDGTLAETEELHRQAFNHTFAELGLGFNWSRQRYGALLRVAGGKERLFAFAREERLLDGSRTRTVTREALSETRIGGHRIGDIHRLKTDRYGRYLAEGRARLRPGVAALILDARKRGLRLAIATTSESGNVDLLIRANFEMDARDLFSPIVAGGMVDRRKPAPDAYLLALTQLGLDGAECLAFEDSAIGLTAAKAAGVATVLCPSSYSQQGDDFRGADLRIGSFTEISTIAELNRRILPAKTAKGIPHGLDAPGM